MLVNNNYKYAKNIQNQSPAGVTFEGYKTVFSKTLDEVILSGECPPKTENKLLKYLNRFIEKKMTPEKSLGKGYENSVYKIDDKYVLRFPTAEKPEARYFMCFGSDAYKDIKIYYGEPVAEFGYDIMILKNVSPKKHIPAGVSRKILEKGDRNAIEEYCYENYLKPYSALPQRAFDRVAEACSLLNKKGDEHYGYCFDFANPNNFVLVGKTIKIVDCIKEFEIENPNNIYRLLDAFLNRYSFSGIPEYTEKAAPLRKEIFKKLIVACEKYNLNPYEDPPPVIDAMWLSGIKETSSDFVENLEKLRETYGNNAKKHIKMVEEYLSTL